MNDDYKHAISKYYSEQNISEDGGIEPNTLNDMLQTGRVQLPESFDTYDEKACQNTASAFPILPSTDVHDLSTPQVAQNTQSPREGVLCLSGITPKEIEWLWKNYVPMGKLTLLQGEPGVGKSYFAMKLAAAISSGGMLLTEEGDVLVPQGNVIYQSAEDDIADTIIPRLTKMHGRIEHIFCIDETDKALTLNDVRIKEALERYRPKLMVLDPLAAYLGYDVDINRSNQVRPLFAKLARWAERYDCAIMMITHLSKSKFTKGGVYASLGSIDMAAACRSILAVRNIANTEEKIIYQVKSNVGPTPRTKAIKFVIDSVHGINWKGVYSGNKKNADGSKLKPQSKLEQAKKKTVAMIKEGVNTSKAMKEVYYRYGIKPWAYNKARKELQADGVISKSMLSGRFGKDTEAKWELVEY